MPGIQQITLSIKDVMNFCAETVKIVQLPLKENVQLIFFYIEDCVTASENISMFFNERAAASKKI